MSISKTVSELWRISRRGGEYLPPGGAREVILSEDIMQFRQYLFTPTHEETFTWNQIYLWVSPKNGSQDVISMIRSQDLFGSLTHHSRFADRFT